MGSGIKALYPQEYLDLPQAIINGPVNDKNIILIDYNTLYIGLKCSLCY